MIVDSSALIPLSRIGRLDLLRRLYRPVRTTRDVYRECVEEGAARPGADALREACERWLEVVEPPRGAARLAAAEGIELADASLLLLCEEAKDALLTNDDHLMRVARARGIRGRWLTGAVLAATRRGLLTPAEAKELVTRLVGEGLWLSPQVFVAVLDAIEAMTASPR